jgi:hypothetical protein
MPAAQLELDAHSMDRQLLDGSAGHLQLLLALIKAGDWEHGLLMLDWLQVRCYLVCYITHFELDKLHFACAGCGLLHCLDVAVECSHA